MHNLNYTWCFWKSNKKLRKTPQRDSPLELLGIFFKSNKSFQNNTTHRDAQVDGYSQNITRSSNSTRDAQLELLLNLFSQRIQQKPKSSQTRCNLLETKTRKLSFLSQTISQKAQMEKRN
jgi:hypothetical protein